MFIDFNLFISLFKQEYLKQHSGRFSDFISEYFFQGQRLFEKLLQLTSESVEIKLVSDVTADSKVLEALKSKGKAKVDMVPSACTLFLYL